ncbi:hypothetical protein [Flavobacterium sp. LB2R40]|uniref:hypothetical protein n=1 Tax=unclassified Flavobacterium TaxID=196869 RepID=UPI003AAFC57E
MKKLLMVFVIIILNFSIYGQNYKGYYVTIKNDTIKCDFDIFVNLFNSEKFDPQTVRNKIKIITNNGEKLKFKPNEINSFFISKTNSGDYKFVSIANHNYFYHEIIKGKLSYYKVYLNNSGGALGILISEQLYLLKGGKLVEINPLNLRKGLSKQIVDYPDLNQKWIDSDKYYKLNQFEEVVKLYNKHFDN